MAQPKLTTIVIATDIAAGLVDVLEEAAANSRLLPKQRKLAAAYAQVVAKSITTGQDQARVRLSMNVVANTLRIILMVIKPDPLVKAAISILGKLL